MEDNVNVPDRTAAPSLLQRWGAAIAAAGVRSVGSHPNLVGLLGTLAAIVVVAVPLLLVGLERERVILHARENADNVTSLIALELERDLLFHDTQLIQTVRSAEDPLTWTLPAAARNRMLFCTLPAGAYVDGQFVVNASGRIIASQDGRYIDPALRLGDREDFFAQKDHKALGLYISHPFHSRLMNDKLAIALTRRINAPDGSFAGVALFEITLGLFQRLFARANIPPPGIVVILLADGVVVAAPPDSAEPLGASVAQSPVFRQVVSVGDGWRIATGYGGVERMYVYRRTRRLPFIVVVAPAMSDVLQDWRRQRRVTIGVASLFGVVLTIGAWLLAFTLRANLRAEAALARLASTDGLTKLSNRRTLDECLETEWQHGLRAGHFLSVLFIDIDRFKLYNDRYGHAEGDSVLAMVAGCIEDSARRSIDTVGRYGGEEFVVILPGTAADGAVQVAEAVRARVEALAIENPGSEAGVVTVSVGCATCRPSPGMRVDALVLAADKQLYEAKSSGRNRVHATVLSSDGAA